MRSTHSQRLEHWLGADSVVMLSRSMRGFHGTQPVPVAGVPGEVYATRDGDFVGRCLHGGEASYLDLGRDLARRLQRAARITVDPRRRAVLYSGFATLGDVRNALRRTQYERQDFSFATGNQGAGGVAAGRCFSYWNAGSTVSIIPPTGSAGSAAPGGRVPVGQTNGGFLQSNAYAGTRHFAGGVVLANPASAAFGYGQLLLYDRIFDVAKTMSSTGTEAVTGVPTRYQSTTLTAANAINGNFLFVETNATIAATAHNWTVCLYNNQANAGATMPSMVGNSGANIGVLDHPLWQWFAPLAAGDCGIMSLTQMQCSASVATGSINFAIGHPIAWMPIGAPGYMCDLGGIATAYNMARIFDGACLSLLLVESTAIQATLAGNFTTIAA